MFDNFLIRKNSLKNDYDKDGNIIGFQFAARNANYRGVFLSLHNGYYIKVDGIEYPRDVQTFEVNGKEPRTFEEIKTCVWEHWDYDDEGIIHIAKPGGLEPGVHTIEFQQSVLAAYGYLPTDEEWVKNPPVPGTGAGSDKTKNIVSYDLELQDRKPQGKIKRGVSLYSYQQTQFFKELDLEGQIREVGENLFGADGIELLDEMAIRQYPNPPQEFFDNWFAWMKKYDTKPVTMDVFHDVLQFRDHVMSYSESAERLKNDIRLAKKLGFKNVRTLATTPFEILIEALPVAEELDIRLAKEIHAPIPINGQYVNEIVDYCEKTGTKHLGLVPDWGIFAFRPSEVTLDWYVRQGAKRETCDLVVQLCMDNYEGRSNELNDIDLSLYSAGNVESLFHRYIKHGEAPADLIPAFDKMEKLVRDNVPDYTEIDFEVMGQALLLSRTKPEDLGRILPYIVSIHGKFYNMSEIPGKPGQYQDIAIDYEGPINYLKEHGWEGYINSEYEGQRRFQDRGVEDLISEIDQVRKHQEMLKRLIGE